MKKYVLIMILGLWIHEAFSRDKNVYIVPFSGMNTQTFFNISARDDCHKCFCDLRTAFARLGYKLDLLEPNTRLEGDEHILVYNVPTNPALWHNIRKMNKANVTLFTWEPAVVMPSNFDRSIHAAFGRIYTWADDLVDNIRYFKFHYPQPKLEMIPDTLDFHSKKCAVMIAGNKNSRQPNELYSKRKEAISFFEKNHASEFDLYGIGWEGFASYKGKVARKVDCLKQYKFCICYENAYENGWITEKIFDSFVAGCLPVYWGARNIIEYIPKNCFIDRRDFKSNEELYLFLKNMDEQTYNTYMDNIRSYLISNAAFAFSIEYFIDSTIKIIDPHYDRNLIFTADQISMLNAAIYT